MANQFEASEGGPSDTLLEPENRTLVPDADHEGDSHEHHEQTGAELLARALASEKLASDEHEGPPDLSLLFSWRPRSADGCSRCPGHQKNEAHDMRGHLRVRPRSAVELRSKSKSSMKSSSPSSGVAEKDALSRPRSASSIGGVNARSRLGYDSGLTRRPSTPSRFPRVYDRDGWMTDINSVIANIKALEKSERAKIAADEAQQRANFQSRNMEITRHKDLCVLKFNIDGTRLMVKRWSKGFVVHPPRRAGPPLKPGLDRTLFGRGSQAKVQPM